MGSSGYMERALAVLVRPAVLGLCQLQLPEVQGL